MSEVRDNAGDESQSLRWKIAGRLFDPDRSWELWTLVAFGLAGVAVVAWGLVLARLGGPSLAAYVRVIPIVGLLTLPVAIWGVFRSAMATPALTARRALGFATILVVGVFCNVPMFAVPLSTEGWESEQTFRLPFDGEWYTLAGGPTVGRNYHAKTPAYRWGYDFAPVRDGSRFAAEGEALEEYYCWGEPVLAPASGEVVGRNTGNDDTAPGDYEQAPILGNHLIVRVSEGVYLFVAHLKRESIEVETGETVERGEPVGECGSSGQALAPHVHVHLQNSADFPFAEGLPLRFSEYRADGEIVERGMPRGGLPGGEPEGERVEPVESFQPTESSEP